MRPYTCKKADHSKWQRGPWSDEPDAAEWTDEVTQLPCAILRHSHFGHLCGYVGVSQGHPLHGKGYNDRVKVPLGAMERCVNVGGDIGYIGIFAASIGMNEDKSEANLSLILFCHGGLSYADKSETEDDLWWFGFDAGHCDDVSPYLARPWADDAVYRDISYVRHQCERLAWQIKLLTEGGTFGTT